MFKIIIITLIILAAAILAESYRETHTFRVIRYRLKSPKLKGLKRELRLVILADLHNREDGHDNKKLLEAIEREKPDLVLIAGDLMVAKPGRNLRVAGQILRELSRRWPVYYAPGNHEYRLKLYPEEYGPLYEELLTIIRECGITFLENENEKLNILGTKLTIHGLMIDREYYARFGSKPIPDGYMRELLGEAGSEEYQILLAHNPVYFDQYAAWGADLTFSGHLHGGIVNIPGIGGVISPQISLFPKYSAGCYEKDGRTMILSRGLGTHTINLRFLNPAELVSVRLKGEE